MYWVYLIISTFIVFIPTLVRSGYKTFDVVQVQEFVIFVLISVCFVAFLIMEKRLKKSIIEKAKYQQQANRMNKDLKQSYSYIGEINRKLDIIENIAIGFPESSNSQISKKTDIYESIMGAIQVFGKSNEFALRFIQRPNFEVLKEIKSIPELPMNFSMKSCEENKHYNETDDYIMVTSPKDIDGIFACIVIKKNKAANQIEDPEIMKTLAAQALFLFAFIRHKKQIKCVI